MPARGQQEASKRPGRGTKWGGPYEIPKPLKNKYFHEEKSPVLGALWKTDFLEKSSWGSLKLARSQEAGNRQARGQQEASKRPTRSQQDASKRPTRGQEASKKPGRSQQEASKKLGRGQQDARERPARCQGEARKRPARGQDKKLARGKSPRRTPRLRLGV